MGEWRRCQSGSSQHNYYAGCNGDASHLAGCSSHYEHSIRAQHCLDYMWTTPHFRSYYQAVDADLQAELSAHAEQVGTMYTQLDEVMQNLTRVKAGMADLGASLADLDELAAFQSRVTGAMAAASSCNDANLRAAEVHATAFSFEAHVRALPAGRPAANDSSAVQAAYAHVEAAEARRVAYGLAQRLLDDDTVGASAAVCGPLRPELDSIRVDFNARYTARRAQGEEQTDRADFALAGYDYDALRAGCDLEPNPAACWHMLLYQVRNEISAYRQVLGQVRTLKFVRAIVNAAAQLQEGIKTLDENFAYIAQTTQACAGEAHSIDSALRRNVDSAVRAAECQAVIQTEYHEVAAAVIAGKAAAEAAAVDAQVDAAHAEAARAEAELAEAEARAAEARAMAAAQHELELRLRAQANATAAVAEKLAAQRLAHNATLEALEAQTALTAQASDLAAANAELASQAEELAATRAAQLAAEQDLAVKNAELAAQAEDLAQAREAELTRKQAALETAEAERTAAEQRAEAERLVAEGLAVDLGSALAQVAALATAKPETAAPTPAAAPAEPAATVAADTEPTETAAPESSLAASADSYAELESLEARKRKQDEEMRIITIAVMIALILLVVGYFHCDSCACRCFSCLRCCRCCRRRKALPKRELDLEEGGAAAVVTPVAPAPCAVCAAHAQASASPEVQREELGRFGLLSDALRAQDLQNVESAEALQDWLPRKPSKIVSLEEFLEARSLSPASVAFTVDLDEPSPVVVRFDPLAQGTQPRRAGRTTTWAPETCAPTRNARRATTWAARAAEDSQPLLATAD